MKTKYNSYPKHKPSGIDWLGQIPENWETQRMKISFSLMKRPVRDKDEIVTAFRDGTVTLRRNRREKGFTNALQENGYQGIRIGDLVIHGMDGFAGAIGISDSEGKATPVYSVCSPKNKGIIPSYYAYLLRSLALSGYITSLSKGIRERSTEFKWNIIGNLNLIRPPENIQKQIPHFLDDKITKLDQIIDKNSRLSKLLQEKRQAVITHTVTKGLNPHVKMKPSGLDWLGQIPEEWETKRLRFLVTLQKGRKPEENTESPDGLPYLTMEFLRGQSEPTKYTLSQESVLVDNDQILLLWDGANAGEFVKSSKGILSSTMVKIDFNKFKFNYKYYFYFFKSFEKKLRELTIGMGIPHVNGVLVRDCLTLIPSSLEREVIAKFLDKETGKIDEVVKKVQIQNQKLQEYRQALISSAVTGKIRV